MAKSVPQPEGWLATLPPELSHGLFAKARPLSLAASRTLFVAGDDGDGCYRVEEGLLKASVGVGTGGERILAIFGPGSVVGELSMIDSAPRSASVTALRDSKLSFVDRATFETFGQSTPELYRHITTLLARRLRDTNEALVATNFLSVKGRVARALLSLAEAFGRDIGQGRILIRQKVSQSDLAAMAGIARQIEGCRSWRVHRHSHGGWRLSACGPRGRGDVDFRRDDQPAAMAAALSVGQSALPYRFMRRPTSWTLQL
jgi:CRP/FNR family transcriptional regulator, cyclic AMP receptor protein